VVPAGRHPQLVAEREGRDGPVIHECSSLGEGRLERIVLRRFVEQSRTHVVVQRAEVPAHRHPVEMCGHLLIPSAERLVRDTLLIGSAADRSSSSSSIRSYVGQMMQPQPLIALADVEAGSLWFQQVLGLTSGHGGTEYEMLMDGSTMVAQLHDWEADEHAHIGTRADVSRGNGVLLWFCTDDFPAASRRIAAAGIVVLEGPMLNAKSGIHEVWLRGPEGYVVVISGA
jgi:hypothetical protein